MGNCRVNKAQLSAYEFDSSIRATIENCTANSSGTGISLNTTSSAVIRDCTLVQSLGTGVSLLNGSSQNTLQGCVVDGAAVNGYTIALGSNDVIVTECQALNVGAGFEVVSSNATVFRNCIVDTTTSADGFMLSNTNFITHDGCTATQCAGNGFSVDVGNDILYRTCSANANPLGSGFSLIAANAVLFCQCIAHANSVGITIAAGCTDIKIIETCIGNNGIDVVNNAGSN